MNDKRLGPYVLVSTIAQGGMGVVFRARLPGGREVAIKLLKRQEPEAVARFERERRVQSSLGSDEGFVPLIDAGEAPEGPYFVMPFVPGGTLRDRLRGGALGLEATVELGRALAHALGKAHIRGIAHRDLKPENILFDAQGRPLIADLGLAKHFRPDAVAPEAFQVSRSGTFAGTAGYTSPEQLRNSKSVGPQADVFALGTILYECLAGEPAFHGDDMLQVMNKVCEGLPAPLASKRPDAPTWLVRAVEKALARAPQDRFPDGSAFERALESEEWGPPRKGPKLIAPPGQPRWPSTEDLSVPPSSAANTDALDLPPTLRLPDTQHGDGRPSDAPNTLRIENIPYVVRGPGIPPTTLRREAELADDSAVDTPRPLPRPVLAKPGPRWPVILALVAGILAGLTVAWFLVLRR